VDGSSQPSLPVISENILFATELVNDILQKVLSFICEPSLEIQEQLHLLQAYSQNKINLSTIKRKATGVRFNDTKNTLLEFEVEPGSLKVNTRNHVLVRKQQNRLRRFSKPLFTHRIRFLPILSPK
jgi:hypothetical protein